MKNYRINEIFYSLQGEGIRAGTPNFFIRFSECNLRCSKEREGFDCDTEFQSGLDWKLEEILKELKILNRTCQSIIFTGGEPSLQLDDEMIDFFKAHGFYLAIESNGLRELSSKLDWICISPKTAEHTLKQKFAHELKYVRAYGQGLPQPEIEAENYLISPAFDAGDLSERTLKWCIQLCEQNPPWRLSVQQHKIWNVR